MAAGWFFEAGLTFSWTWMKGGKGLSFAVLLVFSILRGMPVGPNLKLNPNNLIADVREKLNELRQAAADSISGIELPPALTEAFNEAKKESTQSLFQKARKDLEPKDFDIPNVEKLQKLTNVKELETSQEGEHFFVDNNADGKFGQGDKQYFRAKSSGDFYAFSNESRSWTKLKTKDELKLAEVLSKTYKVPPDLKHERYQPKTDNAIEGHFLRAGQKQYFWDSKGDKLKVFKPEENKWVDLLPEKDLNHGIALSAVLLTLPTRREDAIERAKSSPATPAPTNSAKAKRQERETYKDLLDNASSLDTLSVDERKKLKQAEDFIDRLLAVYQKRESNPEALNPAEKKVLEFSDKFLDKKVVLENKQALDRLRGADQLLLEKYGEQVVSYNRHYIATSFFSHTQKAAPKNEHKEIQDIRSSISRRRMYMVIKKFNELGLE